MHPFPIIPDFGSGSRITPPPPEPPPQPKVTIEEVPTPSEPQMLPFPSIPDFGSGSSYVEQPPPPDAPTAPWALYVPGQTTTESSPILNPGYAAGGFFDLPTQENWWGQGFMDPFNLFPDERVDRFYRDFADEPLQLVDPYDPYGAFGGNVFLQELERLKREDPDALKNMGIWA